MAGMTERGRHELHSRLRVELHDGLRRQTHAMLGAMVTISGVVAAAASLA